MKKRSIINHPYVRNAVIYGLPFIIALFVIWVSFLQFHSPEVVPHNARSDQFSSERAMDYIEKFAVKPHPIGSEEHDKVKEYLVSTLTDQGVFPEIHSVERVLSPWGILYEGKVENIVARIPGEDSSKAIMVSAHYDSVESSPGAADDGAGVASILETVRILLNSPPLKNDVIILLTDGEESGLLGAQAFVDYHPWAKDIALVLNFEARGNKGPSVMFETNDENGTLITEFIKATSNPVAHSFIYDLYKIMPNDTDLTVFKNAGMYGLNFGFLEGLNTYHTQNDNIENLSLKSVQHHGENMIQLVQHFGNIDLIDKKPDKKIYFNLVGKHIVTYSEQLVIPIMISILVAFVLTFVHGSRRKKLTFTGMCLGFLLFISLIGCGFFIGQILWGILSALFSNRTWTVETSLQISNICFVVMVSILFFLITPVYQIISRKVNVYNLTMGAYLSWLLLLIVSSFFFKSASYVFAWPLLFGITGLNILMGWKNKHTFMWYLITILFSIPALLIVVPSLYLLYILFTLKVTGILLAITTLLTAYIIPVLSTLKQRYASGLSV